MSADPQALPAVVYGMPSDEYHAIQALGASGLRKLARSPRHFYAATLDPERPRSEPTPAMKAGTLAHCAILEPGFLAARYIVRPDGLDGRTKEGKAWLAAVPAGVEAVTAEQMLTARRQAEAVRALPDVAALLDRGQPEVSAFWADDETGEACKCRPDWFSPAGDGGVILLDVKTTQDASPDGFPRSIANFGYHLQAAWYSDGFARASGLHVLAFVFACVEADYPHAAAVYMLDDDTLAQARAENRRLLNLYASCKRDGAWPGYPSDIGILNLPAWARTTTTEQQA